MQSKSFTLIATTVLFCLITTFVNGQTSNFTWTGFDLRVPLDSKSQIDIKPIVRHNLDGNGYANTSLDLSYKRSFGDGYFAQILGRTWYMPEARYRQFIWFDIGKSWQLDKLKLTQKFRMHGALDINDNFDADFIRSFTQVAIPVADKLKLSLSLEPWLSLNDDIEVSRYRIESGFTYGFAKQWTIAAIYRYQSDFVVDPSFNQNHIVTTLIYKLNTQKVGEQ